MTKTDLPPAICDYEGSGYQADFWAGKGRDYEDAVERIALQRLLPKTGQRMAEFGAGFGRLTGEYSAFGQVVLVDYSRTLLQQAQQRLGHSDRYLFVAADVNQLPFATHAFDGATLIRVIHHLPNPLHVLHEIRDTLTENSTFILEFANKRNLKAIARYLLRRQTWSPFDPASVEFVRLNYDFHPATMRQWLTEAGFASDRTLSVSYLRTGMLKRLVPLVILKNLDAALQPTGSVAQLAPSIFVRNHPSGHDEGKQADGVVPVDRLFVNPVVKSSTLVRDGATMLCPQTGARWAIRDGIYDFKETL